MHLSLITIIPIGSVFFAPTHGNSFWFLGLFSVLSNNLVLFLVAFVMKLF
jgi:hypothetical protein